MKKKNIVDLLSARTGITKGNCSTVMNALPDVMTEMLVQYGKLNIREFASFQVTELKERKGYNIQTGQVETRLPAKKVNCVISQKVLDQIRASR